MEGPWHEAYRAHGQLIRRGWTAILGRTASFPREVMLPSVRKEDGRGRYYQTANNLQDFVRLLEVSAPKSDVWVGHRPTTMYHQPQHIRPYFDIDSEEIEDGLARARNLAYGIEADFGRLPAALFTANKGFHLHMEHAPVFGSGGAYKDAVLAAVADSEAFPDAQPLSNSRSMPRPPYTFNAKSLARYREPLYAVPIDLSLDLLEIIASAREVRPIPFTIPYVDGFGEALQEPMRRTDVKKDIVAAKPIDSSRRQDLVQAAIIFTERDAKHIRGRKNNPEGIRRVLYRLYIPALVNELGDDVHTIKQRCKTFVEGSGGRWRDYEGLVADTVKRCFLPDGQVLLPMRIDRFFAQNADLKLGAKG